ncbi:MAG: hypothetical protein QOG83_802 [Alphaproteobacteria bacterium]|jgi:hypothetical protein|nr:hypothetical protein [Alphaproteobacteria bacterium]MEA2988091.1 hypothetical protein [Alphaproteobacteria bacterium]
MKTLLLAVLATLLATPALAATYKVPDDNPLVTVVVPDKGWKATKIARGIEVGDDEDEVYLSIEGIDGNNAKETGAAAVAYLNRQGVTVDQSTKTEKEGKMDGFDVYDLGWKGKDKDGDVLVHLTIINITPQRGVLFTYWASPKGDKQHDAAITAMVQSMKKVGN